MRFVSRIVLVSALAGFGPGCSGGGSTPFATLTGAEAQDFIETCNLPVELQSLAAYLDTLQNLFGSNGVPTPEITNINVFTQLVNWSLDLDGDQTPDITGTIQASPPLPIDFDNPPNFEDLNAVLALLEDHTIRVTFDIQNLPSLTGNLGSGNGLLTFSVQDGLITNILGEATFSAGGCSFGVSFDEIAQFDPEVDGFPIADVDFSLFDGVNFLDGTIDLNGTDIAELIANVEEGARLFEIDLLNGTIL